MADSLMKKINRPATLTHQLMGMLSEKPREAWKALTSGMPKATKDLAEAFYGRDFSSLPHFKIFQINNCYPLAIDDAETASFAATAKPPATLTAFEFENPGLVKIIVLMEAMEEINSCVMTTWFQRGEAMTTEGDFVIFRYARRPPVFKQDGAWNFSWSDPDQFCAFLSGDGRTDAELCAGGFCTGWAVGPALSICAVAACSNVEHVKTYRSKAEARKSLDHNSFWTLVIDKTPTPSAKDKKLQIQGCGSSPRTHFRRGHIRRLRDNPIWVSPTIVNPGASGAIEKDYVIRI